MGSADRAYMQGRRLPSAWGGWGWAAGMTVFALVAFLAFHGSRSWSGFAAEEWLLASPWTVREGRWWTVATSAWTPSRTGDAAWTLLGFWFFGRTVEREVGAGRLVPLVLLTTVVPNLVFLAVQLLSGTDDVARGLCGAAAAAATYVALREPHEFVLVLGVEFRVRVLALLYLGIAATSSVGWPERTDARVAVEVAGAALGALAARFSVLPDLAALRLPGLGSRRARPSAMDEGAIRTRVDALLDKVSREGIGALSPSERSFLEEASRRYR